MVKVRYPTLPELPGRGRTSRERVPETGALIAVVTTRTYVYFREIQPDHKPQRPGVPSVRFDSLSHPIKKDGSIVANAIGTVIASPANPLDLDTDLTILVVLNGNPAIALDPGPPPGVPVTFPCVVGDAYSITQVDVNVNGPSVASVPYSRTGTVAISPPTGVPGQPGRADRKFPARSLIAARKSTGRGKCD